MSSLSTAGAKVQSFFSDLSSQPVATSLSSVLSSTTTALSDTASRAADSLSDTAAAYTPPSTESWTLFAGLLGGGGLFLALAFTICLPILPLAPHKFALAFTVGCALLMSAFAALRGFQRQLRHMVSTERLPFSAVYVGSMVATLYFATIKKSYLLTVFFSVVQMAALVYYVLSYFPGGAEGAQAL